MSMLALALWGALAGPPADPDFEAGKAAFAEQRYDDAAQSFERAYRRRPEPLLLFVWAQAERLAGRCEQAVPLYRRYLALGPPDDDVEVTRQAIEACGEDPDQPTEPPPAPDEDPEGVEPEPEPEPELEPGLGMAP
ncbi:MAG: tetratricopeptide repeat protein, partial [Myxococcales bacterium]|nr:tetratricopeptide repeat protein [Myxococcales bacterium]